MSVAKTTAPMIHERSPRSWAAANQAFLEAELHCLRLRLQRRVLWLRRLWQHDPLQSYQSMVISEAQADQLLAGEDSAAEARFYREDAEATALSQALTATERAALAQRQAVAEAGQPPALEVLAHLFGLSGFERNVLLLCLAPELDPAFERLYAYMQDDVKRTYPTPHLALALFARHCVPAGKGEKREAQEAWNAFLPEAPLRRFRLVMLEPGPHAATTPGARPLRLDERVADYLRGVNHVDERIAALLQPLTPAPLTPAQGDLVERTAHALEVSRQQGRWPMVNLYGPAGAGKRAVARALAEQLGLQLFHLDVKALAGAERHELFRLLERETVLLQAGLYLDASEIDDPLLRATLTEVITHLGVFLIVGSRERWQAEREMLALAVAKPERAAQRSLWRQALGEDGQRFAQDIDALVQQFDCGAQAIAQTVAAARSRVRLRASTDRKDLQAEDLWQAAREQAGWHLEALAQPITPCYTWDDIVLPGEVFQQLQEIAGQVAHRSQVYEAWGFGAKLSRGRGISALFAGPSGTGKTMAAEVLANHLQLDLYRIDLAGVVSKYIGETEKNLKKVFDAAERSGAILFFDEADALFGKRTEVKDSHDRYANIEIDYLLQRMEDYRGLAILATNRKSTLDQAFLRRLRFLVDFPFPEVASRRRIWEKVFPPQAAVEGLDYQALARLEIPGGNIRNIALNAAFLAAGESAPIGMGQVLRATKREYSKIEKMVSEMEFGAYYRVVKS